MTTFRIRRERTGNHDQGVARPVDLIDALREAARFGRAVPTEATSRTVPIRDVK